MTSDSFRPVPQRKAVYEDLRRRIASAEWAIGEQVPPIADLQQQYDARSLGTVREAQQQLVEEGMLRAKQGVGTFVVSHTPARRPRRTDASSLIPLVLRVELYEAGPAGVEGDYLAVTLVHDDVAAASAPSVGEHLAPGSLGDAMHELIGMHPVIAKVEHFVTFAAEDRPPATTVVVRRRRRETAATVEHLQEQLRASGWIVRWHHSS
ncbi:MULTISPECIES: winged helix-turn-helix domain-containing protein [Pimelobacter]|uniref:GntR family transcriptional regulator n=1 Tax=Pimelobacter TaxID=2044 RepID=UPI001C04C8EF|nr:MULTISPECIES: winged helix-turn-helix domain-containing protein [Pimelobacter]MBU2698874.1 hypothetical protein [Pimelobacter sp. 30-1]UUW93007.1 winged helix-turn-helix domain-containing protein [Pimelobacter simplex]UUW99040.1 winged helix-turn-helix domain-containing protein [Pimelobacter simplex]